MSSLDRIGDEVARNLKIGRIGDGAPDLLDSVDEVIQLAKAAYNMHPHSAQVFEQLAETVLVIATLSAAYGFGLDAAVARAAARTRK